ncbi:MAG: hypothetical protein ACI4KI_03320 [Candidatus Fimenecus sp.]
MKLLLPAIILFLIGLVIAIVTAVKYSKAKRKADDEGVEFNNKPYVIALAIMFVLFVVAQILLFLNR